VSKSEIAEYVTTSGTLGEPITIYLTPNDLNRLAANEAYSLGKMGGSEKDCYQLLTTMDKQFMAGLAYYSGVLKLGASIVRLGPGAIPLQWRSIFENEVTKLIAIPSFISKMLDYADANKIDYSQSKVDSIVCIGEPVHHADFTPNEISKSITDRWNVKINSTYASTEMATAFHQCLANKGCHNNDDLLFVEVVDAQGLQVKNGEVGEIVVTTLKVEGSPLIRYKTGDLASYWNEDCSCGEKSVRIGPITARKNQLIKYRGTTLYPQSFYNILNKISEISIYHIEVVQENLSCKELKISLAEEEVDTEVVNSLNKQLKAHLKVSPSIALIPKKELQALVYKETRRKPSFITFSS
jgi:phenylacetate-CoA ligase